MTAKSASRPLSTLALKRHRLFTVLNLLKKVIVLHRRGDRDGIYNTIGEVLFDLGGVYIKFLQGVVLQSWMMQRWRDDSKLNIFTKIHPKNLDAAKIIKDNLESLASRIQRLNPEPFAVGSFGHVYEAFLDGKDRIIVKILSPEIRRTLRFDLRLLKFFWILYLKTIKLNKSFNMKLVFEDFRRQTLNEIDYKAEAEFAVSQYKAYKDHSHLVIPKTHTELCTEEIIVQEYIEGISVADILKLKEKTPNFDVKAYVKKHLNSEIVAQLQCLAEEILWGAFHHPFIMGDPHPGNVILLKNDKIALIDFGIKAKSSQNPAAFLKFITAYHSLCAGQFKPQEIFLSSLQFFGRDLYLSLAKISNLLPENKDKIDLNKELATLAEEFFRQEFRQKDIEKQLINNPKALVIFDRLANKNNRFGFKLKVHDAEMLRSLVTLTGLTDLLGVYREVMEPAYGQAIKKVNHFYPDLQSLNEVEVSHSQALNIIFVWLERIATHNPGLFKTLITKTYLGKTQKLLQAKRKPLAGKASGLDLSEEKLDNQDKDTKSSNA